MDTVAVHVASRCDYTNPIWKVLKRATESPEKERMRSVSSILLKYFVVNFGFIVHVDNLFKLIEWVSVYICTCAFLIFCRAFESGRWHPFQWTVLFHYVKCLYWYQHSKTSLVLNMINNIHDLDEHIQLEGVLFHMWKPSFTWSQTSGSWNRGTSLYTDIKTKYTKDLWREKWQMGRWCNMSFQLPCWPGCKRRDVSFWMLRALSKQQEVCLTKTEIVPLESTLLYNL